MTDLVTGNQIDIAAFDSGMSSPKKLRGERVADWIEDRGRDVVTGLQAASQDQEGWHDDALRLAGGGLKNAAWLAERPGIKQGLQVLGAGGWAGSKLGEAAAQRLGIDPRLGKWTGGFAGDAVTGGLIKKGAQIAKTTKQLSKLSPLESGRLVTGGGFTTGFENEMDFFTMSSLGNATDFGNLTRSSNRLTAFADSTRGVWAGGNPSTNVIEYATIQSAGNTVDFGDLTVAGRQSVGGASSSTRGLIFGGLSGSDPYTYHNIIDFVTIATTGNAQDFGDLTTTLMAGSSCANSTRALYCGGYSTPGNPINNIEYVTIATKGNSIDFGNGTLARKDGASLADKTRGITAGGSNPTLQNRIDSMEIATLGDALDFGDLSETRTSVNGSSNAHGGL